MSAPIAPGDEVVCMRTARCPTCGHEFSLQPGSTYVVADVIAKGDGMVREGVFMPMPWDGLSLVGVYDRHGPWWMTAWFRKVGGGDQELYTGSEELEDA